MVIKVAEANQIVVVFDSYIEDSIKESTRASRSNDVEPIEYVNLLLESPSPVELERFWAFSKNKEELQILSREFFKQKAEETNLTLVLSVDMLLMEEECKIVSCSKLVELSLRTS